MNSASILSILLFGLFTGNIVASSGLGVDMASGKVNSIKNSLIYGCIVFGVMVLSGVIVYAVNSILVGFNLSKFMVFVTMVIASIFVQIADYLMEKLVPVLKANLDGFIVVLIPAITVILFSLLGSNLSFGKFLINLISMGLGFILVELTIASVRKNKLSVNSFNVFKGNLITLTIMFVITIVLTNL